MSLVGRPNTVTDYLGMGRVAAKVSGKNLWVVFPSLIFMPSPGVCESDKLPARPFDNLISSRVAAAQVASLLLPPSDHLHYDILFDSTRYLYKTSNLVFLDNGDPCSINQTVIVRDHRSVGATHVSVVREIVQHRGSVNDMALRPDGVLLQLADSSHQSTMYAMPHLALLPDYEFVPLEVCAPVIVSAFTQTLYSCVCSLRIP